MIIRGWLRGVKTLVQGHTAKNKFEPRSLSLQCASKSCACNNYTNFVSVPWTLKSRERETLMAGHDTGLSLRGQCRLDVHFLNVEFSASFSTKWLNNNNYVFRRLLRLENVLWTLQTAHHPTAKLNYEIPLTPKEKVTAKLGSWWKEQAWKPPWLEKEA